MVAVIKASKSIARALHYNEQKLKTGAAELIHSANYLKDTERLGITDKLQTLKKYAALNEATKVNCLHISLNFDPSEKVTKETLKDIADTYMKQIGFADQPYLVYEHKDVAHQHVHIVTTNIRRDGTRIPLHNIGKEKSEPARVAIEKEFKLVKAQGHQLREPYQIKAVRVEYGQMPTKRAITNVLDAVIPNYKYTSLAELNAVLKLYNLAADPGGPGSRTFAKKGLTYRVLDKKGAMVGVPIKASDFYFNPGLKYLEKQYAKNESLRDEYKESLKNKIDYALFKVNGKGLNEIKNALRKEQIDLVLRINDKGQIYGATYVDHYHKTVFNGSDLGKPYSANQLIQRATKEDLSLTRDGQQLAINQMANPAPENFTFKPGNTLESILQPENDNQSLNPELKNELRKRKRKRLHH